MIAARVTEGEAVCNNGRGTVLLESHPASEQATRCGAEVDVVASARVAAASLTDV